MSETTQKFTGLADIYEKNRPLYPKEAISFIIDKCSLDKTSPVADIGCGTGISTRLFIKAGLENIIGIEPNHDMRRVAQNNSSAKDRFQSGTAEDTGFEDNSLAAIISAQAFHWFKAEDALQEFHRILNPNGYCVLMWNVRDESDPFTRGYGDCMFKHSTNASDEVKRGVSGKMLLLSPLFQSCQVSEFSNKQIMDWEGLQGRAFSTSYAPRHVSQRDKLLNDLESLYKQYSTDGNVTMKYITSVYIAKKVPV